MLETSIYNPVILCGVYTLYHTIYYFSIFHQFTRDLPHKFGTLSCKDEVGIF